MTNAWTQLKFLSTQQLTLQIKLQKISESVALLEK